MNAKAGKECTYLFWRSVAGIGKTTLDLSALFGCKARTCVSRDAIHDLMHKFFLRLLG